MTRKDYVEVARILSTVRNGNERMRLTNLFIRMFSIDNAAFQSSRFREAVEGEPSLLPRRRSGTSRRAPPRSRR
jgi:hypothetical protein